MFNFFELNNTDDFKFMLDSIGQEVQINKQPVRGLITNTLLEQNYDDKKITTLEPLNTGDLIRYDDQYWIIISEQGGKRYNKHKAIMRLVDYHIKFNFVGRIQEYPAIVDSKVFDTQEGKYITLPVGKIMVTLQENQDTLQIALDQRFIKMGSAFKVVGIDRTKKGLIQLTCDKVEFNANDDQENEIVDGKLYYVRITNIKPLELDQGQSVQITYDSTTGSNVLFTSNDNSIATVDSNGLVTGLTTGTAIITASLNGSEIIKDTIEIIVNEVVADISVVINGSSEIKFGQSGTWTAKVMQGTDELPEIVTWSLWNDAKTSTTDLASITSTNGNSITLKAASKAGYIQLKAQYQDKETWMRIQVKSLF